MDKVFNVVIERDAEGFYVATVPALRGCHTQARSLDVLMDRVREAIEVCLEVEEEDIERRMKAVDRLRSARREPRLLDRLRAKGIE